MKINQGKLLDAVVLTDAYTGNTSAQTPLGDATSIELHMFYDPDEASPNAAQVICEVSDDSPATAAASSTWIQVNETTSSSGTLTGAANVYNMVSVGAGTLVKRIWRLNVAGTKFRVSAKETDATDYGNMTVNYCTIRS